jgi:hypothetical protein
MIDPMLAMISRRLTLIATIPGCDAGVRAVSPGTICSGEETSLPRRLLRRLVVLVFVAGVRLRPGAATGRLAAPPLYWAII